MGDGGRGTTLRRGEAPSSLSERMICGVDEAGRGPVIGPLVVAAVAIPDQRPLSRLGVRDSKRLKPSRREELAQAIKSIARHETIVVPAEVLDRVMDDRSLNLLESEVFATAIARLRPDIAYVDAADVVEEKFRAQVKRHLPGSIEVVAEHSADDCYPVVSAASILAKSARDAEVRRIGEELGEDIGSGYCHDPVTIAFLRRWLKSHGCPPPHCRTSWETTRRLLMELHMGRLDDFGGP
jgi:ribonuclease HII